MAKRKKKGLKHHIKHKSKLGFLFIIKIAIAFIAFFIAGAIFSQINQLFGLLIAGIITMIILFVLYLILLIKILKLFKFR